MVSIAGNDKEGGTSPQNEYIDLLDHSPAISAGSISIEEVSGNKGHTVRVIRWPGLLLHLVHLTAPHTVTSVPANLEDTFSIGLRGVSRLRVRASRLYDAVMEPGMMVLLPRGTPSVFDEQGLTDLLLMAIDPSFLGNVALEALDVDPARTEVSEQFPLKDSLIVGIGTALIDLREPFHSCDYLYAESLTNTLAIHMLRNYGVFPPRSTRLNGGLPLSTLRIVKDYIQHHPSSDLTLVELSRLANLSVAHFATLFKASTGQSVHQYVLHQRIDEAKRLLLTTPLTLAEVAAAVGFADQAHFTRTFKRIVGTTPGALQKRRNFVQNPRKNLQDQKP